MKVLIALLIISGLLVGFYKFLNVQVLRKTWWKKAGMVLFLLCLIGGLIFPIGAGISSIQGDSTKSGDIYRTELELTKMRDSEYSVFLRADSTIIIQANQVVKEEGKLLAEFQIPKIGGKQNHLVDLYITNEVDGVFGIPNAITIQPDTNLMFSAIGQEIELPNVSESYFAFPFRRILFESIRNIFYHVPLWFAMTLLTLLSAIFSVKQLKTGLAEHDLMSAGFAYVAILYGLLGFATGSLWGNFTWGSITSWLLTDIKILGAMLGVLMYFAYFILRNSISDHQKKSRVAAVYNIIAFVMYIVFIYVMPRTANASLHPGNANNPAFSSYDLDGNMRMIFYPAVIAYMVLGVWFSSIWIRTKLLQQKLEENILN